MYRVYFAFDATDDIQRFPFDLDGEAAIRRCLNYKARGYAVVFMKQI